MVLPNEDERTSALKTKYLRMIMAHEFSRLQSTYVLVAKKTASRLGTTRNVVSRRCLRLGFWFDISLNPACATHKLDEAISFR
jgi:hypothetical protein